MALHTTPMALVPCVFAMSFLAIVVCEFNRSAYGLGATLLVADSSSVCDIRISSCYTSGGEAHHGASMAVNRKPNTARHPTSLSL